MCCFVFKNVTISYDFTQLDQQILERQIQKRSKLVKLTNTGTHENWPFLKKIQMTGMSWFFKTMERFGPVFHQVISSKCLQDCLGQSKSYWELGSFQLTCTQKLEDFCKMVVAKSLTWSDWGELSNLGVWWLGRSQKTRRLTKPLQKTLAKTVRFPVMVAIKKWCLKPLVILVHHLNLLNPHHFGHFNR